MESLTIVKGQESDRLAIYEVFSITITDAFAQEGLGHLKADIEEEINTKCQLLNRSLLVSDKSIIFLIAKINGKVVGTISLGPLTNEITKISGTQLKHSKELGSLYILPEYQNQRIGSHLIDAMITKMRELNINNFWLDCGLKTAQKKWLHKFGKPYIIAKDYWGKDSDHMIWFCHTSDFKQICDKSN